MRDRLKWFFDMGRIQMHNYFLQEQAKSYRKVISKKSRQVTFLMYELQKILPKSDYTEKMQVMYKEIN